MSKIISLLVLGAGGAAALVWLRGGAGKKLEEQVHGAAGRVHDVLSNTNGDGKAYALAEKAIDRVSEAADRTGDRVEQIIE
jgi:hypothetical protein